MHDGPASAPAGWPAPRNVVALVAITSAVLLALALSDRAQRIRAHVTDAPTAASPIPATRVPATPAHEPAPAAAARDVPVPVPNRALLERSSLRGAAPDGVVTIGADGLVRVDRELRRRFDWYLSLAGELDASAVRGLLGADVEHEHGIAIASQVIALFDRYADYLRAESALLPAASLPDRLATLHGLRERLLGAAMAEAFFSEEERYAAQTLERIAAGGGEAPADAPQREAETASFVALHDAELARAGADATARHEERAALWGEDAAQRLAALDAERADWDLRVADYRRDAGAIRGDAALDAPARERALAALRTRSFDANERVRIEALEAVGGLPGG